MIRLLTAQLILHFWSSPHHSMAELLAPPELRLERKSLNLKVLDPGFPRDEPSQEPARSTPIDVPAPEPRDVPSPEPRDVPAPEPHDIPAPEPGDIPAPEPRDVPPPSSRKCKEPAKHPPDE